MSGREGTAADVISDAGNLCAWWKSYGSGTLNTNGKAVAYLLNNANWSDSEEEGDYLDENVAEWVIGGPTEDIFLRSYNQYNGLTADTGSVDDVGFTYKTSGTDYNATGYIYDRKGKGTGYTTKSPFDNGTFANDTVYNRGYAFWLASPGSYSGTSMNYLYYEGTRLRLGAVDSRYIDIRPLVCLKSTAQITKGSSGWTITMP